jgi:hypothetical protein
MIKIQKEYNKNGIRGILDWYAGRVLIARRIATFLIWSTIVVCVYMVSFSHLHPLGGLLVTVLSTVVILSGQYIHDLYALEKLKGVRLLTPQELLERSNSKMPDHGRDSFERTAARCGEAV